MESECERKQRDRKSKREKKIGNKTGCHLAHKRTVSATFGIILAKNGSFFRVGIEILVLSTKVPPKYVSVVNLLLLLLMTSTCDLRTGSSKKGTHKHEHIRSTKRI